MFFSTSVGSSSMLRQRKLRLERLESRQMLSHPGIAAVHVASTQWTPSFVSYLESSGLGTGGYKIPTGSAAQLQTLPWKNIDQIRITFTEDVTITAGDLALTGVNKTVYAFSAFTYDPSTYTAAWTLAAPIGNDKLLLDLDADGFAPVRSAATGEVLDGAWTNSVSSYPSGNTQGGVDFEFRFNVLPGDADASNDVSPSDAAIVLEQINAIAGQSTYDIRCDVDGSGEITVDDYNAVPLLAGTTLPTDEPLASANDGLTASAVPDSAVAADAVDYVLSSADLSASAETSSAELLDSIVQRASSPSSSAAGTLSTDSSGTSTTMMASSSGPADPPPPTEPVVGGVIVPPPQPANVPPVISNFNCANTISYCWTLSGTVTDANDPVAGDVVTFGGVFASYNLTTTVESNGSFSLTVVLEGLEAGTGTAQTSDPHGALSNLACFWVVVLE
jgi:hypothetical protein